MFVNRIKPLRVAMIGGFGLMHGMGFAYALGNRISESGRFYQALFLTNLGVELAQVTVIGVLFLVFRLAIPEAKRPAIQKWASGVIACTATILLVTRL